MAFNSNIVHDAGRASMGDGVQVGIPIKVGQDGGKLLED